MKKYFICEFLVQLLSDPNLLARQSCVLLIEIKADSFRALENAVHAILETRGKKVMGGEAAGFKSTLDEVMDICGFVRGT